MKNQCDFKFIDFRVSLKEQRKITANPVVGSSEAAMAHIYSCEHIDGWTLDIAYMVFPHSQCRDVRCLEYSNAPIYLHRLQNGLRMSIKEFGDDADWLELSQARMDKTKTPGWSNLKMASINDLNKGAGFSINKIPGILQAEVGLREDILEDSSTRRNYLCILFDKDNQVIPISAYLMSRVYPLINNY
jgi:hypothetical protein